MNQENEEYPVIVGNGKGEMWMFSMRRHDFPRNTELISAFYYNDEVWSEMDPVTARDGQYEAHTAICPPEGEPLVAWTELVGDRWKINVSMMDKGKFSDPHTFETEEGRYINPVLFSREKGKCWLAWESLFNGRFKASCKTRIL